VEERWGRVSTASNLAYYGLWFAHPVLEAGVAAAMVWRKLHRTLPAFFTYVVAQIVMFAIVFPTSKSGSDISFYTYWASIGISIILGFRVLHEIFLDIFRPYHTLRDLGSVLFKWVGLVMLLVAGVVAASTPVGDDPVVQAALTLQRSMRVAQVGLVFFLLVFSRYLGVNWRQKSFGIAAGLGAYAAVELIIYALFAGKATSMTQDQFSLVIMAAYNLTLVAWIGYMAVKSPVRDGEIQTLRTRRWEEGLNDIQHPRTPESLIPMFESMVDRALSRTHDEPAPPDEEELTTSAEPGSSTGCFSRRPGESFPRRR